MERIYISSAPDEDGIRERVSWFDADRARYWEDAREWDGQGFRSMSTNRVGLYQRLYRTAAGRWVRGLLTDWEDDAPVWEYVDAPVARDWLVLNEHGDVAEEFFGEVEEERGPGGRPPIPGGVQFSVIFPAELAHRLDEVARERKVSRAWVMRAAAEMWLKSAT